MVDSVFIALVRTRTADAESISTFNIYQEIALCYTCTSMHVYMYKPVVSTCQSPYLKVYWRVGIY